MTEWMVSATDAMAASASDAIDLAHLFQQQAPFLLRVVERLIGSGQDAEDVVQQVFLVAHQKRAELSCHPDLRGWLYRVAINHVRHHRRSIARRLLLFARARDRSSEQEIGDGPEEEVMRRQTALRIRRTMMRLPLKQREVFVLFELESLSGEAIAEMLEVPLGTVWSRLRLARESFKRLWEDRR